MMDSQVGAATFPRSSMNIADLRQTTVRQIEPLLEEEARHWRDELHWDYRGALELIKRFLDAHALAGCVAFENGVAAGYSFYVLEDQKGLIGGLYVSSKFPQDPIGRRLLEELLISMRAIPHLARIEAQLMPFSGPVDTPLLDQGFQLYTRQFMLLPLGEANPGKRPHPRVHAIYRPPVAKCPAGLVAALLYRVEQARLNDDSVAGRDGADEPEIRVAGFGDRESGHG